MDEIRQMIYTIRLSVFRGNYQRALDTTIDLLGRLMAMQEYDTNKINEIAQKLMLAMQNKDYLLLADIVYFEIPSLWQGTTAEIDALLEKDSLQAKERENGSVFAKLEFSQSERP